ncbi:hypothetical protein [Micromonospora purpureochromogenes]|uniref:Uncharacterized protein n=1 Tax=Micromonospora purpureochromogenes TaxID=47872 RepID=A0ABX2RR52_9ACTN|nr:hypothetical protein [Micromonospora purpureochromogenes]NYF58525.1 hypothetical protein [Micromonospora purpureochromogenes]
MSAPFRPGPPPGARPGPPPGARPGPPPGPRPGPPPSGYEDAEEAHHPAVDAAVQAMINAEGLPPADQIAQYEAAYQTLRETLATIDQA